MPTINVAEVTKKNLDNIKIHPRETYDEVISRIVEDYISHHPKDH